jgi:ribosomal protein S18 acetylase RimI-like enzyme
MIMIAKVIKRIQVFDRLPGNGVLSFVSHDTIFRDRDLGQNQRREFRDMNREDDPRLTSKRPGIKLRQMEIDDLAAVFHLGETLFSAQKVPNLYRTWDEFEVIELYKSDPEFCFVATADEKIVGFALGTTITKSHSAWKYGHLVWLGVDTTFHRMGVAERLFNRFKDIMVKEGVRMLLVDTEAENLPALHLFRKLGFGNPEQHIYLTMNLASQQRQHERKQNGPTSEGRSRNDRNHRRP